MEADRQQTDALTKEVKRLIIKSRTQPTAAGMELCALGGGAIGILCSLAQTERKRTNGWRWFSKGVTWFGYLATYFLVLALRRGTCELYQFLAPGAGIGGGCATVILRWYGGYATRLLASLDNVRAVGPLLDVLSTQSEDSMPRSATIRTSLSRLLPRLKASDAPCLLPRHIAALNSEIASWHTLRWHAPDGVAYALVLLKTLEQVGNESSIQAVERVLHTTKNPQVREAAESCLPFLQARAVMGRHTLLRAATAEGGELLRAATGSEGREANLLRPTSLGNDSSRRNH